MQPMTTLTQRALVPCAIVLGLGIALSFATEWWLGWLVGGVGVLGLVWLRAGQDASLVKALTEQVDKQAGGQLLEPVKTSRKDEFAALVAAVNRLAKSDTSAKQANTDPLTGLANRRGVLAKLQAAFARNEPLALFYIDLDKFKPINDQFGHEEGDAVLKQVAATFLATVREQDTVARLGGDEFLLVMYGLSDKALIEARAKKLLEALNEPLWVEDRRHKIGGSIGIVLGPNDGATVEELLNAADETMYAVKKAGRNNFKFYS
jgi:diguanylate cyclase (GGDEF)-like protein